MCAITSSNLIFLTQARLKKKSASRVVLTFDLFSTHIHTLSQIFPQLGVVFMIFSAAACLVYQDSGAGFFKRGDGLGTMGAQ